MDKPLTLDMNEHIDPPKSLKSKHYMTVTLSALLSIAFAVLFVIGIILMAKYKPPPEPPTPPAPDEDNITNAYYVDNNTFVREDFKFSVSVINYRPPSLIK